MRPLATLCLFAIGMPAFAWGPEGHALIARIAAGQLSPAARSRVAEILGPGATMESVASWADQVRPGRPATAPWHFIDIPLAHKRLDMAHDCGQGGCVVSEIAEMEQQLRNPATPAAERREALMFLIHFVGDMHQPLHSADNQDRGGNSVQVMFLDRPGNLHSVWDSGLLGRMGTADQLFPELSRESARHAAKFSKGTVEQWAEECHKAAVKTVYGKLPKTPQGQPVVLDAAYEKAAGPVIRHQIEIAGARLAQVLNRDLE